MPDRPKRVLDLRAVQQVSWTGTPVPGGVELDHVWIGPDPYGQGIQVAVARAGAAPSRATLRALWDLRAAHKAVEVVVVIVHGGLATMFGPDVDAQPIENLPLARATRHLQSVLDEPNGIAAYERFGTLRRALASTGLSGFTNSGLFASHYLAQDVLARADSTVARETAQPLLTMRNRALIEGLGFRVREEGSALLLSTPADALRAVAVLLDENETFDTPSPRFQLSPVAFALSEASRRELPWVIALRDDRIRLYPGRNGVGVGQKGQVETFFEIDLAAVDEGHAALLPLVFSARALEPGGSTDEILDGSRRFATDLGTRLRNRIYDDVVPPLAAAVAARLAQLSLPLDEEGLRTAYRLSLRILFRLLFQAYAEARGLLPAGRSPQYDAKSLRSFAKREAETDPVDFSTSAMSLWSDLEQVWAAIDRGNEHWMVPVYDGGLFTTASPEGELIQRLNLPDSEIGPVLQALLVDVNDDGVRGLVDFRSLSVREFGTIYEGLLESSLSVADTDLTAANAPAGPGDAVATRAGQPYFRSASGERKATGSYYTPAIVVDHLIERSIVPVLQEHLGRIEAQLEAGDAAGAGRDFFDFRVADLAMGSGHFLVAAIDKVEALYRDFLTSHQVPAVAQELLRIKQKAVDALGKDRTAVAEIEDVMLLRRQVARRCIYGIDVNPLALELSRLALWIHTFVPGLPMSSFDHNLVCANSLTGIGTVQEAIDALEPKRPPGQVSLVDHVVRESLVAAKGAFLEMANADEADKAGIEAGAALARDARAKTEPARAVFDLAVAVRTGTIAPIVPVDQEHLTELAAQPEIRELGERLQPAHMPYLFPEVFERDRPGFDVLLGNPPWEKAKVEVTRWWALRYPGLRSLPQAEQDSLIPKFRLMNPSEAALFDREVQLSSVVRRALLAGPYRGMGRGDPDLYLAFAWRNFQLTRREGRFAIVIPRSLLSESGGADWRTQVFDSAAFLDVTMLENSGRWVFDMEPRYTIALICVARRRGVSVHLSGPFNSERSFREGARKGSSFRASEFRSWGEGSAFPILSSPADGDVYRQMRLQPRLDANIPGSWRARPFAELHSTADKPHFALRLPGATEAPVYKGKSFNVWLPDTAEYYGAANPTELARLLLQRRRRQALVRSSPYSEFPSEIIADDRSLPFASARIAIRKIARATDKRTIIAALVPPKVTLTDGAPFLLWPRGDARDVALVLGILSSVPLDWASRRTVEVNVTYHVLNGLPFPRPNTGSPYRTRVIGIAGRLAAVDARYQEWADEVGVPVGSVKTPEEKADLIHELDALVSLLYGLTEDQVEHVFATFHRGWDYRPRLDAVLQHYAVWKDRA